MTEQENASDEESDSPPEGPAAEEWLNNAELVVAAFGGVRPMAARLGVAATTIQGWKSRGNIPENRREVVLEAAAADGLDLSAAVVPDDEMVPIETSEIPHPEEKEELVPDEPVVPEPKQGNGIAWLALAFAFAAGIAVLTQPKWSPVLYGEAPSHNTDQLDTRIIALESRPKIPDMSRRVAALERAVNDVQARAPVTSNAPDLTPRLDALRARLDNLVQTLEATRTAGRTAIDEKGTDIAALRESLTTLNAKVEQAVVDTAASTTRKSSMIIAVGALEVALREGAPYGFALDSLRRLAEAGDGKLTGPVADLAPHASAGVPTQPELAKRLSKLVASRGKRVWTADGESWTDKMLRKFDAVITVRRIDDAESGATRLVQAQRALSGGDLPGAAAMLHGLSGPAGEWAQQARNRITADKALLKLRLLAIERLDQSAAVKTSAQ